MAVGLIPKSKRQVKEKPYGPRDAGIPMSLDEFEEAEFERGWRYEIIRGVLVVSPSPSEEERDANEELGMMLRVYCQRQPLGEADSGRTRHVPHDSATRFRATARNIVRPDGRVQR